MPHRTRFASTAAVSSVARSLLLLATVLLGACKGDDLGDLKVPAVDDPTTYWELELDHSAINLALTQGYDTVRLHPIPRGFSGAALPGVPGKTAYSVSDPSKLSVTSDGLLTAKGVTDQSSVFVRMTIGSVTHIDTALVRIVPTPPASQLDSFSVQPAAGDSTIWSMSFFPKLLNLVAKTGDGTDLQDSILVNYRASNPSVLKYDPAQGGLLGGAPGHGRITASTYAFGVSASDSVTYTITNPTLKLIFLQTRVANAGTAPDVYFDPDTVVVQLGAVILWSNFIQDLHGTGIVFDDPSVAEGLFGSPDAGNIDSIPPGTQAGRMFNRVGKFVYHDTHKMSTGVIDVRARTPSSD